MPLCTLKSKHNIIMAKYWVYNYQLTPQTYQFVKKLDPNLMVGCEDTLYQVSFLHLT